MENFDVIILSAVAAIGFVVFIVGCFREFSKMENEEYRPSIGNKKFGRDAIYDMVERMLDETKKSNKDKIQLLKRIDRTIADMESDGMYFSEEIKEKLEKEREELFCEYSGLPSPKAYNTDQI